jgi:hypothetical protein
MKCERPFHLLNEIHFLNEKGRPQRLDSIFIFFRLRTCFFKKKIHEAFHHRTNATCRREGEQEQESMCCLESTVCFSSAIDGQSVSAVIVRGLCHVCNSINSVTFVTDEQNSDSLCPTEGPANLVPVRIPSLSVRLREPHMYPRSSAPSDV